jgi:carotenoid cleavage dioxygenase-like enzyme
LNPCCCPAARFHLLPKDESSFEEDSQLLASCDFALNKRCNGQRHAIEVKTGREAAVLTPIAEFPVVHAELAALAEKYQPNELPL